MAHKSEDEYPLDSDKSVQDPRFERARNASATGDQKGTKRKLRTDASGREITGNDLGIFEGLE